MINADETLWKVFEQGKEGNDPGPSVKGKVSMFEMTKLISKNLK